MTKRIVVGFLIFLGVFVSFFALPPIGLPVVLSVLSMTALYEVIWATGLVKHRGILVLSMVLSGIVPIWTYLGQNTTCALVALFLYFCSLFLVAMTSDFTVSVDKIATAGFFAICIPYFFSAFIRIAQLPNDIGYFYLLTPLIASSASDTFAYFTGVTIGKHKLVPKLSPKKTIEGSVGGLLGAMLTYLVYGLLLSLWFNITVSYFALAVYGVVGSAVAQIGDLSFSYIKRQQGIKDFGNIFPGHGGVLDRFDSTMFCAPVIELFIILLPALG